MRNIVAGLLLGAGICTPSLAADIIRVDEGGHCQLPGQGRFVCQWVNTSGEITGTAGATLRLDTGVEAYETWFAVYEQSVGDFLPRTGSVTFSGIAYESLAVRSSFGLSGYRYMAYLTPQIPGAKYLRDRSVGTWTGGISNSTLPNYGFGVSGRKMGARYNRVANNVRFPSTTEFANGNVPGQWSGEISWQVTQGPPIRSIYVGSYGYVPEPSVWAMLTIGFGMIGAGLRRRAIRKVKIEAVRPTLLSC